MTKPEAIEKVRKLRRLAGDAGVTAPEARTARRIAGELCQQHGITPAELEGQAARADGQPIGDLIRDIFGARGVDLDDFLGLLYTAATNAPSSAPTPGKGHRPRRVTVDAVADHAKHPHRVHLAVNSMRSVCGVGPTFVWTYEREIAIRSGEPCPHCMQTGVIDARQPQLKLPPNRLRDARGRWI